MIRGLLTSAAVLFGVLLLMTGMYWILDILPVFGFAALVIAYAALSRREPSERRRTAETAQARKQ